MDKKIIEQLADLGLEKNQANVYLAVLEIGPESISNIANRAKVKRPTCYLIIDQLLEKGLIIKVPQGRRVFYKALPPKKYLKTLESKKDSFEKLLPQLNAMFASASNQPKVRFFEGKEGLRSLYQEMLATSKSIYSIFSYDDFLTVFSQQENADFFSLIEKSGGMFYDMVKSTPTTKKALKQETFRKSKNVRVKLLPQDFEFKTDLVVSGNKTAMISFGSLVGVIIEDLDIAQMQQSMIKYLWKTN